jgi:hypothetical protein
MIVLASTTDILRVATSSANAIDVHCTYVDNSTAIYTPARQNTTISAIATTTVLSSPAASVQRQLKKFAACARGGANTIILEYYDGTTAYRSLSVTLAVNETLEYEDAFGWRVTDVAGAVKQSGGGGSSVSPATTIVTETAYGQASAVGVALTYAREDHTHGTPATTALTPAASVTAMNSFALAAVVGTSVLYARQDHVHSTPATPVTSNVAGTGISVSGATGAVTIGNTGVISVTAGTNVTLGGTAANPVINATAGAVSSVTASGAGITASPTTGAVIVANTGVTSIVAGTNVTVSGATGAVTVNSTGGAGTPAVSVVTETAYGQASAVGVGTNYARQDHTHGTPALPTGTLLRAPQYFTTSGTCTHPAGTVSVYVQIVGGGGGGGGSGATTATAGQVSIGGGGAAGAYLEHTYAKAAATSAVVIGAAGVAGAIGATGGTGGTCTVTHNAIVYSAFGGDGGQSLAAGVTAGVATGGTVGFATGGTINSPQQAGYTGLRLASGVASSGMGGNSMFGPGGAPRIQNTATAQSLTGNVGQLGAGGSGALTGSAGAIQAGTTGGNGSSGIAILWEYS